MPVVDSVLRHKEEARPDVSENPGEVKCIVVGRVGFSSHRTGCAVPFRIE